MSGILVPVKAVPDIESNLTLSRNASGLDSEHLSWTINPLDEIALGAALDLCEQGSGFNRVTAVSVGSLRVEGPLRTALAMGADAGILVHTDISLDSFLVAETLAAIFRAGEYELMLLGKQAIDTNSSQTGQFVAEALRLPFAGSVSSIRLLGTGQAEVIKQCDFGEEILQLCLPAIITADLRLAEPRYPTVPGIIASRTAQLKHIYWEELGICAQARTRSIKLELLKRKRKNIQLQSAAELAELLRSLL